MHAFTGSHVNVRLTRSPAASVAAAVANDQVTTRLPPCVTAMAPAPSVVPPRVSVAVIVQLAPAVLLTYAVMLVVPVGSRCPVENVSVQILQPTSFSAVK